MSVDIKLIEPAPEHLVSYESAKKEYRDKNIGTYGFTEPADYDIFERFRRYRLNIDLPENRVPQTTLWLVGNDEFIGEIGIRHRLNDALLQVGGHIGYWVRHSKWNMGYGTEMLRLALPRAKALGLDRVLITCDHDNIGSARVIEKNGGILENIIEVTVNEKPTLKRRYWIDLS